MRILFSSVPAAGHLLPLLPLIGAARRAGHEAALLTAGSMRDLAPSVPLLAAGASMTETLRDVQRRSRLNALEDMAQGAVEFFVESRLNLGLEQALAAADGFRPDFVIADMVDYVGQFVAAARGVPWAAHGGSLPLVETLAAAFGDALAPHYRRRSVVRTVPVAFADPWPDSLLRATDRYPAERVPVRPEPHAGNGAAWEPPRFAGGDARPVVLVTLGTVVEDPTVLRDIVTSLQALDVNVLLAPHTSDDLGGLRLDSNRVHAAGFVPMKHLLDASDLVVSTAGAGTLLATLSAGLPTVLLPMGLDKPVNAERAAATGAAHVVASPAEVAAAVGEVLTDATYTAASAVVAADIARTNSPEAALDILLHRAGLG